MFINNFDPVAFQIFSIEIRWYSLAYIVGISLGWILGKKFFISDTKINEKFDDYITYLIVGLIIGGRLGYVIFYNLNFYSNNLFDIFKIWQGGMSFHGGFLGVLIGMMMIARKYQIRWLVITDFIAPLVPLGLGFGRIGNFINQELWGRPTDAAWGMIFPAVDDITRHPSQLYQSFFEGLILFLILWFYAKKQRGVGKISALFLIFYGLFRFLIEFTREPDGHLGLLYLDFSMGQWLSLPMLVLGIFMYFKKFPTNNND